MTAREMDEAKTLGQELRLLSPAGRVILVIAEGGLPTLADIGFRVGLTGGQVSRLVSSLVEARIVARTKVKSRNRYHLDLNALREHPDIIRLLDLTAEAPSA